MDLVGTMYVVFFVTMGFSLLIIIAWVAGKDILIAFKRKIFSRGCDVYLANQTRTISHFYMIPKEGIFRIRDMPYVTNPEKTINLTEEEHKILSDAILKRKIRLQDRIKELTKKKDDLSLAIKASTDDKQKFFIASQIENYNHVIRALRDKLRLKQENYFKDKRPAFFYIENDPIPKDFYEYYSALDSKMVDNLVSRAITQPASAKQDKNDKKMMVYIIVATIAAIVAGYFGFMNNSMLTEICQKVGASCKGLI